MPGEGRLRQDGADQGQRPKVQRPKVLPTTGALKPLLGNQHLLTSRPAVVKILGSKVFTAVLLIRQNASKLICGFAYLFSHK